MATPEHPPMRRIVGLLVEDPAFRRLVHIMAAERTVGRPADFNDAVQEGLTAAWRAETKHPGNGEAYYRTAARRAIVGYLTGRSAFGAPSRRGRPDAYDHVRPTRADEDGVAAVVDEVFDAGFDTVDLRPAVRAAVAGLEDRDRWLVFLRFWEDMTFRGMADLGPDLFGEQAPPAPRPPMPGERPCDQCGQPYRPKLATSRYCSPRCRTQHSRAARGGGSARPVTAESLERRWANHVRPALVQALG